MSECFEGFWKSLEVLGGFGTVPVLKVFKGLECFDDFSILIRYVGRL